MRRIASSILLVCLLVVVRHASAADTAVVEPAVPAIDSADAIAHAGEECTVEFTVESARKLPGKAVCFLNSCRDHRDEKNFTVMIFKGGLDRLKADGIESPAEHFEKATIRVRGVIEDRDGRPQIVVEEPGQITIVKDGDEPAAAGQ